MNNRQAVHLLLTGLVQGVGLRPALLRWAGTCQVYGWCMNTAAGVEVHAEAETSAIERFVKQLPIELPGKIRVQQLNKLPLALEGCTDFSVRHADTVKPLATLVPTDRTICPECSQELYYDERRKDYAFHSCAECGPRYSLLRELPYERCRTAMEPFPLCAACEAEYRDVSDRRFHAQTMGCTLCGPRVFVENCYGDTSNTFGLDACAAAIRQGKIVALCGIGGYQLLCLALDASAVRRLRQIKARQRKPFAILVKNLDMAQRFADISGLEEFLLSPANPIMLCPARMDSPLTELIHPGLSTIGVMLPGSALHLLLAEQVNAPMVVTSGNQEGEPLIYQQEIAREKLSSCCDLQLHHSREIYHPVDDSLVQVVANQTQTIRLARGLAPLPLPVDISEPLVAVGGQQKVALALANGKQAILGPHLGEMDTLAAQERFTEQYQSLCQLYGGEPGSMVHDQHPDYFTTRWVEKQPVQQLPVQHHHAHVVSGMLEYGWLGETVLGIVFDGTGYGSDQTIWGGEILRCDVHQFERLGHLRRFRLIGNELAIKQPQRIVLALLVEMGEDLLHHSAISKWPLERYALARKAHGYPQTSSMGRLFDGVAAIILGVSESTYEGEPALLLEAACDRTVRGHYPFPIADLQLDWRPLLSALLDDFSRGVEPGVMAMKFHRSVALAVVRVIQQHPDLPVVLSGGCFQNKILTELILERTEPGRRIGVSRKIPCNDGGLAAGQLVIGAARQKVLVL